MTAEVAVALPGVVLLLAALLATASVVLAQIRCVDAARAAARLAARREPPGTVAAAARAAGPPGSRFMISTSGEQVVVVVRANLRLRFPGGPTVEVGSRAVADLEPEAAALEAGGAAERPGRPPVQRAEATRTDRGAGSVLMLAMVFAAATGAGAVATIGQAVALRHGASAAADLAALAGAAELQRNPDGGCARSVVIAAENGARVQTCVAQPDGVLTLVVASDRSGPFGLQIVGRARAGPAGFTPRTTP